MVRIVTHHSRAPLRSRIVITAAVLLTAVVHVSVPAGADATPSSFTFGAAGDFSANTNASATLATLAGAGTDFFFALGDLS